jgi:hypothetical protein
MAGSLPDNEISWLTAAGQSTGSRNDRWMGFLSGLGFSTGTIDDRMTAWLNSLGATSGDLNDRWMSYLGNQGFTGTINDRMDAYFGFTPFSASNPTPLNAVWASDPLWSHPANGAAVSFWRNQSGDASPSQATGAKQPTYRATVTALNNKPAVQFAGAQGLSGDIVDIAQPFKLLAVVAPTAFGTEMTLIGDGTDASLFVSTASKWSLYFGGAQVAVINSPLANTSGHVLRATVNAASSSVVLDETTTGTPSGSVGTNPMARFSVGAIDGFPNDPFFGYVAYAAIYASTVSDASLTALAESLGAYYGITVA